MQNEILTKAKKKDTATLEYLEKLKDHQFTNLSYLNQYFNEIPSFYSQRPSLTPLETPFTMRSSILQTQTVEKALKKDDEQEIIEEQSSSYDSTNDVYFSGDIKIENADLSIKGKKIVEECNFTIVRNRIYGLVGRNGIGKTTLLKAIRKRRFGISRGLKMYLVRQENKIGDESVFEYVIGFIEDECEIRRGKEILKGVGFAEENQSENSLKNINMNTKIKNLSGGWAVRANLAKAIFNSPDLLLLDEPTNMLDIPTIVWLENQIQIAKTTVIIVSHDREFLNNVCTDILHLDDLQIKSYTGNYDQFIKLRKIDRENQQKGYEKQKVDREHLQAFIDKFRYNAKRASLAQSKIKILENMKVIKEVKEDPIVKFKFNSSDVRGTLIELKDVSFSYKKHEDQEKNYEKNNEEQEKNNEDQEKNKKNNEDQKKNKKNNEDQEKNNEEKEKNNNKLNYKTNKKFEVNKENSLDLSNKIKNLNISFNLILKHLNLKITDKSRIVIVGPNGAGKSTLLKLLSKKIEPSDGTIIINPNMKPAYFTQHHIDHLKLEQTVLQFIMKFNKDEETCRKTMAGFGLLADRQKIKTLSGGQKSRLAFSKMSLDYPNILLLDEPTNHLDIESIDGLGRALNNYSGAVICVSHDLRFVESVFEEVWVCKDYKLDYFKGTIRDYRDSLMKK
ncbi:ATP-binding cassette sub- F member 3 [Gurleya vavrai]